VQPCSRAVLQPCSLAAVQPCSLAALQPYSLAALQPCSRAVLQPCSRAGVQPCSLAGVQPCSHAALQLCSHAAMKPCSPRQPLCSPRQPLFSFTALQSCAPNEKPQNLRHQQQPCCPATNQKPKISLSCQKKNLCSYKHKSCDCSTCTKYRHHQHQNALQCCIWRSRDSLQGLQWCCDIGLVLQHDVQLCQHWSTMMVSNTFNLAKSRCGITLGVIGIYLTQLNLLAGATLTLHSLTGPSFCVL